MINAKDTGTSFASTLKDVDGPNKSPEQTPSQFNPHSRRKNHPLSLSFNHFEDFGKSTSNDGEINRDLLNVTCGSFNKFGATNQSFNKTRKRKKELRNFSEDK